MARLLRLANVHPRQLGQAMVSPLQGAVAGKPSVVAADPNPRTLSLGERLLNLPNVAGFWRLGEPTGTTAVDSSSTAADGVYAGSGGTPYTLDQPGIGDGSKSTLFDGISGRVNLTTPLAALNTAMGDKSKGSIGAFGKVTAAGVWIDGTSRFLMELGADASNRVFIYKNNTNNLLTATHMAGGTLKQMTFSTSTLDWFSIWLTWDKVADQAKMYVNGIQRDSTLTGLGTWVGSFTSGFTALASFSSAGGGYWSGFETLAVAANIAYSAAQIAAVSIL